MELKLIKYIDRYVGIPTCTLLSIIKKSSSKLENTKIKKILLAKFSGFGNVVLAIPSIRALRKKFPEAEIVFLTHTMNKSVIENEASISRVITFDVDGAFKTISGILKLIKKLKKEKFDLVLDFEQFSRFSAVIFALSNIKLRVGFNTWGQGRGGLYNIKVPYTNKHTQKLFGDLAAAVGAKVNFNDTSIIISKKDKEKIDAFILSNKIRKTDKLVGIHPGCGTNNPKRKWDKENFAKLADWLIDKYKAKIFFTGSEQEKPLIKEIKAMMKNKAMDTSGLFNLRELAYIISRSKIFFSNDTGPLHLASAMKTPVAAFFGPNTPVLYGPIGEKNLVFYKNLPCSPCTTNFNEKSTKCKHFNCIKTITFEEVGEKIEKSKLLK